MRHVFDRFYAALMALAALALLGAFTSVMLGIVDRQVGWGLRGLDAYAGYGVAAALFLALPGTLQKGEHIRVTLVMQRLPAAWRAALEWWSLALGTLLAAMLAGYAVRLVWISRLTNDVSQGSDATPLWIPQIGMALGCIGLLVAMLDAAWSRATGGNFEQKGGAEAAHVE
jgi:TRAP-type C4-dicarboxylate transport system permease small subunit